MACLTLAAGPLLAVVAMLPVRNTFRRPKSDPVLPPAPATASSTAA
ncbi:hypothetical protein [Streptomyces sp. NPDC056227]